MTYMSGCEIDQIDSKVLLSFFNCDAFLLDVVKDTYQLGFAAVVYEVIFLSTIGEKEY